MSDLPDLTRADIAQSIEVKQKLLQDEALLATIEGLAKRCVQALRSGHRLFFAGNGGSYSDSLHIVAELTGRFERERRPLRAHALGANGSHLTAVANDYGYAQVFSRELEGIASQGDVLVALSCSGNSDNILHLVRCAQAMGIDVFGLSGADGGELALLCDCICVPSARTARIQECHILIGHIVCAHIEQSV